MCFKSEWLLTLDTRDKVSGGFVELPTSASISHLLNFQVVSKSPKAIKKLELSCER